MFLLIQYRCYCDFDTDFKNCVISETHCILNMLKNTDIFLIQITKHKIIIKVTEKK